jgi:Apea-like HEPN
LRKSAKTGVTERTGGLEVTRNRKLALSRLASTLVCQLKMEASAAPTTDELNCLVPTRDGKWVQGFLRLPSQEHHGRLRVVEEIPDIERTDELSEPVRLVLQDKAAGTPACIATGFVTRFGFSVPVPPAFPLSITATSVIVGSDNPGVPYAGVSLKSSGLLEFFDRAEIAPEDLALAGFLRQERASTSLGDLELTVFEVAEADFDRSSASLAWWGEIALHGEARPLNDWTDPLVRMLGFFAFSIDRPLTPERIFTSTEGSDVDYYVRWQRPDAPARTARLLRQGRPDIPFPDLAARWFDLWRNAEHFVNHVNAYQSRRDRLSYDDRVLVLARSLELYHGYARRLTSALRSRSEHKNLREAVVSALPSSIRDQHQVWIEGALNEANRKRLATQVEEILDDLGADVQAACAIDDVEEFASTLTVSRNYFTHPKRRKPKKLADGRSLIVLANRLWFVVRACVLIELGLPRDDIAATLQRSGQRHYLMRN